MVSRYGSFQDGVPMNGVMIESQVSDKVVASRDGVVVLVDPNLKGYGQTVILEHDDQYSTVYARNSEILVLVGQKVRRGDEIARAGKEAKSFCSNLYFELRKNLKTEDPLPYLSG